MKFVKQCLLTSLVFCAHVQANPQKPFSPCSTDMPVIVQNNISDAMNDICSCLQTDIDTAHASSKTIQTSATYDAKKDLTKYANISVEVNNKPLSLGQKITLNVNDEQPLIVRVSSDLWSILDYLMELNLLHSYIQKSGNTHPTVESNEAFKRIKHWTVNMLRYTYCLFDDCEHSAEHVYEQNKMAFLLTYAKLYKNTCGLFGSTLTIEIPIDATKLKNEIIANPHDPTVDFYDILDIVVSRLNDPEHIRYTGSWYQPVIQIV